MALERQELRPLQELCLETAKSKNTIVVLPTGEGKTLIAARLIEYYLKNYPDKRAVFLVPTQSLVDQQAKACREQVCVLESPPSVLTMVGDEQAGWGLAQWHEAYEKHHIFLGTPAVFQKAIVTSAYLSIAGFCVVVFDECHNAKKRSPMASIMRDVIHPHIKKSETGFPRILGLTASFANGKTNNLEKDRRDLEGLLNSTIFCPQVEEKLKLSNYVRLHYNGNDQYHTDKHIRIIETNLEVSLNKLGQFKDIKKTLKQCSHVFCELGRDALAHYLDHVVVQQIQARVNSLESMEDDITRKYAKGLRKGLAILREEVKALGQRLSTAFLEDADAPPRTQKLRCLLDVLLANFSKNHNGYRGIVFVEQVSLVDALAKEINDAFAASGERVRCGVVAGSSAQKRADRKDNLEAFQKGETRILVATSAAEEGLDVPQCQFSVMYSQVKTTKSHTQRSGRVRHSCAEIYYLENDPTYEVQKAARMRLVARDSTLSLSETDLDTENTAICSFGVVTGKHPYPSGGDPSSEGLVTVFNCKEIFLEYVCSSLGESINPTKVLYDHVAVDGHQRKVLTSIRYPTPEGWKSVNEKEVHAFWDGEDLSLLFSQMRAQGKPDAERKELLALYVIVRKLREEGLLDRHSQPLEANKSSTKQACVLPDHFPPQISLKPKVTASLETRNAKDTAGAVTEAETTNTDITLEESPRILLRYVGDVLTGKEWSLEDDLFHYDNLEDDTGRRRITPTSLKFPTPAGWGEITYTDYLNAFGTMDLDDQLNPEKHFSVREKVEMAFAYLAVNELCNRDHLNEEFKPFLTRRALLSTRESCAKCPFRHDCNIGISISSPTSVRDLNENNTRTSSITSRSTPHDYELESVADRMDESALISTSVSDMMDESAAFISTLQEPAAGEKEEIVQSRVSFDTEAEGSRPRNIVPSTLDSKSNENFRALRKNEGTDPYASSVQEMEEQETASGVQYMSTTGSENVWQDMLVEREGNVMRQPEGPVFLDPSVGGQFDDDPDDMSL